MHAHRSLTNETTIIQDCLIRSTVVCMKKGRVFGTIVFEESLVKNSSANIAYIY